MKKKIKKFPDLYTLQKKHKNKVRLTNYNFSISNFNCGRYGLKVSKSIRVTYHQIEAVQKVILFNFKKRLKFWLKVNFNEPVTSKNVGIRMGRGVGSLNYWVSNIVNNTFLIELSSIYYGIKIKKLYKLLHFIIKKIKVPLVFFIRY